VGEERCVYRQGREGGFDQVRCGRSGSGLRLRDYFVFLPEANKLGLVSTLFFRLNIIATHLFMGDSMKIVDRTEVSILEPSLEIYFQ
jgi:hypothetical protein